MANNRKVQVDIYRLLKKTGEGLDFYEELFEKFENAPNLTIKERLEGELKKEIKKLQRQREQIKAFIASPDVKDTKQLEVFRKKIEAKMEAFKVCEREMKTKTFSKEGLALAANDWAEAPLAQVEAWLKSAIEESRKKVEIMEYEFQKQQGGLAKAGRRGPNKGATKTELQIRLEKLNVHIFKWESLLRMLSNEEAEPEEVDALREHIEKVLEEDADLACISNMAMYDDFDIPEPKLKPIAEEKTEEEKKDAAPRSKSRSIQESSLAKNSGSTSTTPKLGVTPSPLANPVGPNSFEKEKNAKASSNSRQAAVSLSKVPTGALFAAWAGLKTAAVSSGSGGLLKDDELGSQWMDESIDNVNDDTFGGEAMEFASPGTLAEMANATMKLMPPNEWESQKLKPRQASVEAHPIAPTSPPTTDLSPHPRTTTTTKLTEAAPPRTPLEEESSSPPSAAPIAVGDECAGGGRAPAPLSNVPMATTGNTNVSAASSNTANPPSQGGSSSSPSPPTGKAGGPKGGGGGYSLATTLALLDVSLANLPHTLDVERQRPYEPPNAIDPIPYFPQEVHPVLSSREIYHHFDLETLFFIFYYHQKSYQQYFASKELKAHSFRFHTELKRWYQRREKPKETTSKSERGAYTYFDYEDTWQKQTVDDFVFEYKYLEDELN